MPTAEPPRDAPYEDEVGRVYVPPGDGYTDDARSRGDPADDDFARVGPVPVWPPVPDVLPAAPPVVGRWPDSPPGVGLDLTISWPTLIGRAREPASLGRVGALAAHLARGLALRAAVSPDACWRLVLTGPDGAAMAVTAIRSPYPRRRAPAGPGMTGRVTVVLPVAFLEGPAPAVTTRQRMLAAVWAAAVRLRDTADRTAAADRDAPGSCAHTRVSAAYRPPPLTREHVTARDVTCRSPHCGQPAWRGDLDHTRPWDQGGLTCNCNLGALCRFHHRLKQRTGWALRQSSPGVFEWITPSGRTYRNRPDRYVS